MHSLEIVVIDLDEQDNPQVIFESLNYRGEPLQPNDLIRNFIFLEAAIQRKSIEDLHSRYFAGFDRPDEPGKPNFWKQRDLYGRYYYQRMDL